MKLTHFKELDGVRAIAALMVMFFHFFQNLETQNAVLSIAKKFAVFGQTGVSLFFVLSGFLITRILLNTKNSASYFLNFYIRRALRIFPLYYLFLGIFYFLMPLLEKTAFVPFQQQIWYWVYLQNVAMTFNWNNFGPDHFWSLSVEEHFYLFWPLIVYFFTTGGIKKAIAILIAVAFITRLILLKMNLGVFYFTLTRMDELVLGAFLAVLELEGKLKPGSAKKFILLFFIIMIPTLGLWVFFTGLHMDIIQVSKFILLAICYFSLIGMIITLKTGHWLKKILQLGGLSYTGRISYGLYVYHPLCFYIVKSYLPTGSLLLAFVLCFLVSYLTATLSYYLYESRFLTLKDKFQYNFLSLRRAGN